jgi:hypothetical protein
MKMTNPKEQAMWMKRWIPALRVPAFVLLLTSCGGDDADWLFPLWVPTDVQTADIDGDGRLDIITIAMLSSSMSQSEGHLVVRRQTAPGVFTAPQTYIVGVYPWKLAVADVDGDGAPDLVLADAGRTTVGSTDGAVWLLKQDPANRGSFLPRQLLMETSSTPYGIAVGDVNGDSVPDLVLTSQLAGTVGATLLVQDAAQRGTFLPPAPLSLQGDATAVAIGDLNGDGRDDIVFRVGLSVVNGISTTALGCLYQQIGGTLSPWGELPSPQHGINSKMLTVTDVDGDGVNDVVEFFTPQGTEYQARIMTLLQDPAGNGFTKVDSSLAGIRGIDGAMVGDLDGNGLPDIAIVGFYPVDSPSSIKSDLNILLQDGTGAYHLTQSLPMPISASRVAAGDLNADGLNDVIVLGGHNEVLAILQSAAAPGTFMEPRVLK